jgi:hypothetical protein
MRKKLNLNHWIIGFGSLFIAILISSAAVRSDTPWKDLDVQLFIEIGNDPVGDFMDAEETVERGRFIQYKIVVTNTGSTSHFDLNVLMNTPQYMSYVPESTRNADSGQKLEDIQGVSPLQVGLRVDSLYPGDSTSYILQYQVTVPEGVKDDPVYTLGWASATGKYSVLPVISEPVETVISGEPRATLNVLYEAAPPAGDQVFSESNILYIYNVHNVGGLPASGIVFQPIQPDHTTCSQDCEGTTIPKLEPNRMETFMMSVQVNEDIEGVTEIINPGYDLNANEIEFIEHREPIVHPTGMPGETAETDFIVEIEQVPNIILNSPNGQPRPDKGDLSETVYEFWYEGRKKQYTYPNLSSNGKYIFREGAEYCSFEYPHKFNTHTYAYNSHMKEALCEDHISKCGLKDSSILFSVNTTLPQSAPRLVFTVNEKTYNYGEGYQTGFINGYMQNGGRFNLPDMFTESRAVENGANGIVGTTVNATVSEDKWQYVKYDTFDCPCPGEGCYIKVPRYRWEKVSSEEVPLNDTDETNITVYTSTAWLKTEGGHMGTNEQFTNNAQTDANVVDLGNPVIKPNFLTPSDAYTPPGETNAEYMIFGNNGTGAMVSESGDSWMQEGAEFPYLQRGEVYDREENPRNFAQDLIDRQMYGQVKVNELPQEITDDIDLGDDLVWLVSGDLTIGRVGGPDIVFKGGQSRIYVTGTVTINSNIVYETSVAGSYNDITVVRLDAENIFIDGSVTNLELMLLARGEFRSGVSKKQLRILGDVIAGQAIWERQPLNELNPTEFNKPSEHVIEDMRKYVIPAPGDTTVPDDYNIWRQVNPATGKVLDAY